MKLLILTQTVDENDQVLGFFTAWLERFAVHFDKVTAACLNRGKYRLPPNVKVISLGKEIGRSKVLQLVKFYFLIFHFNEYDAVFVHMNPIWMVLGGPVWKLAGKKTFLWYTHKSVTGRLRLAEKFSYKVFTASKESFRLPSGKVVVTGHGIDTEIFKPANRMAGEICKILTVGRIAPVKNLETLIQAVKILKNQNFKFHVTIVGAPILKNDEVYLQKLKDEIRGSNSENYFTFSGKKTSDQLVSCYHDNDIFVHLSQTGSVDKVVLEAMACGLKVLSSNDSARSFLSQRLIFHYDNSIELARKVIELSSMTVDPALREYVIEHHNLDNLIAKLSHRIQESISYLPRK